MENLEYVRKIIRESLEKSDESHDPGIDLPSSATSDEIEEKRSQLQEERRRLVEQFQLGDPKKME